MNKRNSQASKAAPVVSTPTPAKRVFQDGIPDYVVQLPERGGRGVRGCQSEQSAGQAVNGTTTGSGAIAQSDLPVISTSHPETWPKPRSGSRIRGIFGLLVKHMGKEVEMSALSAYSDSLTAHTQVATLRDDYQLVIENRCERYNDGIQFECRSYYRLLGRAVPCPESIEAQA
jgi:hypothetical protein